MQTTYPSVESLVQNRAWHLLDAKDKILGRLATRAAVLLMGKHKPVWSPHLDCGDFVVVTNARQIKMSGKKLEQKAYFSHSGYPDGAKLTLAKKLIQDRPQRIVQLAVRRMLPKTKLGSRMMARLKIYSDQNHPHGSQNPG